MFVRLLGELPGRNVGNPLHSKELLVAVGMTLVTLEGSSLSHLRC